MSKSQVLLQETVLSIDSVLSINSELSGASEIFTFTKNSFKEQINLQIVNLLAFMNFFTSQKVR